MYLFSFASVKSQHSTMFLNPEGGGVAWKRHTDKYKDDG